MARWLGYGAVGGARWAWWLRGNRFTYHAREPMSMLHPREWTALGGIVVMEQIDSGAEAAA